MLDNIRDENVLFLDIETVSQFPSYELMSGLFKIFWDKKCEQLNKYNDQDKRETPDELYNKAGIYAEFGKIICISCGFLKNTDKGTTLRIKSFYSDQEINILTEFNKLLDTSFNKPENLLCAHNGKEFDYPYIARRTLIRGLPLPKVLDIAGKKPWEVQHLDTLELWKFGDYKTFTSLDLLAAIFNIPTPKDDIDGSMVNKVYWTDKDLPRIVNYCQKDVVTVAQLYLKYKNKQPIEKKNITIV